MSERSVATATTVEPCEKHLVSMCALCLGTAKAVVKGQKRTASKSQKAINAAKRKGFYWSERDQVWRKRERAEAGIEESLLWKDHFDYRHGSGSSVMATRGKRLRATAPIRHHRSMAITGTTESRGTVAERVKNRI